MTAATTFVDVLAGRLAYQAPRPASGTLAWTGQPASSWLILATIFVVGGWALHLWLEWTTRPTVPTGRDQARPTPLPSQHDVEAPAIVSLLTNGYEVPPSSLPATVLDLSARGWLQLTASNSQLFILTDTRPPAGDRLASFEQHTVGYLGSIATNDAVSGAALARNRRRLNRRWWHTFRNQVAAASQELALTEDRYPASSIAGVGVLAALGLVGLLRALQHSTDVAIADSWRSRGWWLIVLIALGALAVSTWQRYRDRPQSPTELGHDRACQWLGYRARLDTRIPENASVLGTPHQQRALADGVVTGVARTVYKQLPIVEQSSRWGWSSAGGNAHTVHIRYPIRPGYGYHPISVAAVGIVAFFVTRFIRGFLLDVSDGNTLASVTDRIPGGTDIIRGLFGVIAVLMIVPLLVSMWCVIAGVVDTLIVREIDGTVVRTRTPDQVLRGRLLRLVQPLGSRSRYRNYIAVDDGRRSWISAWLTGASKTAPQQSDVRVRVTPLLGYVHSCDPLAPDAHTGVTASTPFQQPVGDGGHGEAR